MKLKNYFLYLGYVLNHKKLVFKECMNHHLYLHAFTHDLSKFKPCEFIPYAKYFYGNFPSKDNCDPNYKGEFREDVKADFKKAWKLHYTHNKHHHEYWSKHGLVEADIPTKYLKQMFCDLIAMGLKFGDTAQEFYINHYDEFVMSKKSKIEFEKLMFLNESSLYTYDDLTLKEKINILYVSDTYKYNHVIQYYRTRFSTHLYLENLLMKEIKENDNEKQR